MTTPAIVPEATVVEPLSKVQDKVLVPGVNPEPEIWMPVSPEEPCDASRATVGAARTVNVAVGALVPSETVTVFEPVLAVDGTTKYTLAVLAVGDGVITPVPELGKPPEEVVVIEADAMATVHAVSLYTVWAVPANETV